MENSKGKGLENIHPIVKSKGRVERFLSYDRVRASVVDITELCQDVAAMQKTSPSSTIALSRLLVATTLLASHTKDEHEVAAQISCDGPLKSLFAHCTYDGRLRGSVGEKQVEPSLVDGQFSLKPLVGEGYLIVSTHVPRAKQPRKSQVKLVSGEIGPDITHYLHTSMQIQSLISLGVQVSGDGHVQAAGGVLIELMPGHKEETVAVIEKAHSQSQALSDLISKKADFTELLKNHSGSIEYSSLAVSEVQYLCSCKREKAAGSLELLGLNELSEIVTAQETLNIDCDMCGLRYDFHPSEIQLIYDKLKSKAVH